MRELSINHEKFVIAYVRMGNATKAYMSVYPNSSYDAARASAADLLAKANIKAAVAERQKNIANELGATREFVISRLLGMIENGPPAQQAKAMELLGKHHGMWTDKIEQVGDHQVVFTITMGHDLNDTEDEEEDEDGLD